VLAPFERAAVDSAVALHAPFAAPRQVPEFGANGDGDGAAPRRRSSRSTGLLPEY
jgi:hypothetical protein